MFSGFPIFLETPKDTNITKEANSLSFDDLKMLDFQSNYIIERNFSTGEVKNVIISDELTIPTKEGDVKEAPDYVKNKCMHMMDASKTADKTIDSFSADVDELLNSLVTDFTEKGQHINDNDSVTPVGNNKVDKIDTELFNTVSKHLQSKESPVKLNKATNFAVMEDVAQTLPPLKEIVPNAAFQWPFELDTFQKQAILCLERNQSVFVAAHTSAGKTVVAEYACAMCHKRGSRAIFTSPIKALSNQKFRDFRKTFGEDVGLLTGDIKIAVKSSILIMTTEILHNMLCNSAETIRDLEIVIMDEVHYLNDPDRGHIWEEIMIMLPKHVRLVMLSATVPNTLEFADWLGRVRGGCEIHVVMTNRRPVPLEHHLYLGVSRDNRDQLMLIVDKHGKINISGYRKCTQILDERKQRVYDPKQKLAAKRAQQAAAAVNQMTACEEPGKDENAKLKKADSGAKRLGGKRDTPGKFKNFTGSSSGSKKASGSYRSEQNLWSGLLELLKERELMPTIVFFFSRVRLENTVHALRNVDLLTKNEKNEVKVFLRCAMHDRLKSSDRELPNVRFVCQLVQRGIGIHHARMLPLMKEIVEMLFSRGLVRILFATETFAMGVNMPARCVIFSSLRKHDGTKRRLLTSSEYTQMAGRAGRRGLDDTGSVFILVNSAGSPLYVRDPPPSQLELESVITGRATQLQSRFRVTYSMILHLHRVDWITPKDIMRMSFKQAGDLKHSQERQNQLKHYKNLVKTTNSTDLIASGSSSAIGVAALQSKEAWLRSDHSLLGLPVSNEVVRVACPNVDSKGLCVDSLTSYYLACCKYRAIRTDTSARLCNLTNGELAAGPFNPGRLVVFAGAAKSATGIPHLTVGAIVRAQKSADSADLLFDLMTWEASLQEESFLDPQLCMLTKDEEELAKLDPVLREFETSAQTETPWPPQLMSLYKPHSKKDAEARLQLAEEVPWHRIHAVLGRMPSCVERCLAGGSRVQMDAAGDRLAKALKNHRNELCAASQGFVIKRRDDSLHPKGPANKSLTDAELILQLNEDMYARATWASLLPEESLDVFSALRLRFPSMEELQCLRLELCSPLGQNATACLAPISTCMDLRRHFSRMHQVSRLQWAIQRIEHRLSDTSLPFHDQYTSRLAVLERWNFVDRASAVGCLTAKGRVACELTQMEVLLTEVLFDGLFTDLSAADSAALLSCFVVESRSGENRMKRERRLNEQRAAQGTTATPQRSTKLLVCEEKNVAEEKLLEEKKRMKARLESLDLDTVMDEDDKDGAKLMAAIPGHLRWAIERLVNRAAEFLELQEELQVENGLSDARVDPSLVPLTRAWAMGESFAAAMSLTDKAEGDIVRSLQRLDELLRHVHSACFHLGDSALARTLNSARDLIRRGVVCAPSLYISEEYGVEENQSNEQLIDSPESNDEAEEENESDSLDEELNEEDQNSDSEIN